LESPTDTFRLFEINEKANSIVKIREEKSKNPNYRMHELTRELIFMYAMSMLSRYRITK